MRILIDARYLDGSYTGIGTYSYNLIENLARIDSENFFYVLVRPEFEADWELGSNFQLITYPPKPVSFATLFRLGGYVDSLNVDLMHSTFPIAPVMMRTPLIVTVHDLQPFLDPDFSARRALPVQWGYNFFYRTVYPATFRRAKWILNVSYHTRDSVAELFPDVVPKLIIVHSGLDRSNFESPVADFNGVRERHGLSRPYLLYYGSTRPNKNIPNSIRGFAEYRRAYPESDLEFVMILKKDRFFRDIEKAIRSCHVRDHVRVLDQVSPDDQQSILAHARAFMFATKYEGFGFPALEAMAAGVPVIAGASGALPEICGDAAEFVSPDDATEIAAALHRVLDDQPRRSELTVAGLQHARRFDWKDAAERVRDIYRLLF